MRIREANFQPIQVTAAEVDDIFEKMLRRFVRRTRDEGVIDEVRLRARGYQKPSERRRAKKSAAGSKLRSRAG